MDIYEEIVELRRQGRRGAVATITTVRGSIPSFQTAKMLVRDDGSIAGTVGGGCVEAEVWQAAREVMEDEKPRALTFNLNNNPKYDTGLVCGGTLEVFIEPVLPPALLYIFGAGHVAYNLYKVAQVAGFEVIVVDNREGYANRERFPDAREVVVDTSQCAGISVHRHCDAWASRRHARAALGRPRQCEVPGDDRFTAKDNFDLQGTGERGYSCGEICRDSRTRRPRDWCGDTGRDRCGNRC
jgi:xanthine/CO dehydrogenase XdhC/CoxF family maturation factor